MTWLQKHHAFAQSYGRAREWQGDSDADQISDIRQQVLEGSITPEQGRVAIDSLKWSAARRARKRYGERQQVEHSGSMSLGDLVMQSIKMRESNER